MENGTNHKKIFQLICRLKTTILETELVNVPIVNEKGMTDEGNIKFKRGIRIRLAPPPQIALIQKATIVLKNRITKFVIIFQKLKSYSTVTPDKDASPFCRNLELIAAGIYF